MDKAETAPDLITCLLNDQFPQWAHLPIRPVELDGSDNTTFRLGTDKSVRLPSGEIYSAQIEIEHRWLPILAPQLPLAIPQPLVKGLPGCGFPWAWSVYRWLPGAYARVGRIDDLNEFAGTLANFVTILHTLDASKGPMPDSRNFWRGGPTATYDHQARIAIAALANEMNSSGALEVWEAALATSWENHPVWLHGDLNPSNLLVVDGRLSAVIDFGNMAVGDPACDLAIAWTFFTGDNRKVFRESVGLDAGTWARGRGWTLWKAAITLEEALRTDPSTADAAGKRFGWRQATRQVLADVIADHCQHS
jgi:aminoglycoside phosphotransferase (APT) family kinase protein